MVKIILGILMLAAFLAAIYFIMNQYQKSKTIVLGQQMADAQFKEQERLKRNPNVVSPMPEKTYEQNKGEWELLNPVPNELDSNLRSLCDTYTGKSKLEQAEFRSSISMDEFYTLIEFSRRSAVFAINNGDPSILTDGLTAIAMIEAERTDYRDIIWTLAFLHHSATRIGMNTSLAFAGAAKMAESRTSTLILGFSQKDSEYRDLKKSWGYCEVNTSYGVGFSGWGAKSYNPKLDLLEIAIRLAYMIENDSYYVDNIELATDIPSGWLDTPEKIKSLPELLKKIVGGVHLQCRHESDLNRGIGLQQFTVYLVEMDSPESTQALLELSKRKKPDNYCMLGIAGENLFVLIIARSFMKGVESIETGNSLERFITPIEKILHDTVF